MFYAVRGQRGAIMVKLLLACLVIWVIVLSTPAQGSIWLAHQFSQPTTVAALAVDDKDLSLLISTDQQIIRAEPNCYATSSLFGHKTHCKYSEGTTQVENISVSTYRKRYQLAPLDNQRFLAIDGETITLHHPPLMFPAPTGMVGVAASVIFRKGARLISDSDPAGELIAIKPSSVATNGRGDMFIGGEITSKVISGDSETNYIWQLVKDGAGQWHLRPLARGSNHSLGCSLASTRTDKVVVAGHPDHCRILPEAGGLVELREIDSSIPTFAGGIAVGSDGRLLVSDPQPATSTVFSLHDGSINVIAGSKGAWNDKQLDPLKFRFTPGAIATSPDGGIFVDHRHYNRVLFIGPNDAFEVRLTTLVSEATDFVNAKAFDNARAHFAELRQLANTLPSSMQAWRAAMAMQTLHEHVGHDNFEKIRNLQDEFQKSQEREGCPPPATALPPETRAEPTTAEPQKKIRSKKNCCFRFWHGRTVNE